MLLQGRLAKLNAQRVRRRFRLRSTTALAASLSAVLSLGLSTAALADEVIDGGASETVPPPSNVIGNVIVGQATTGTLNINGTFSNALDGVIGQDAGSTGTVTLTGPGAAWTQNGNLFVGDEGIGILKINSGTQVTTTGIAGIARNDFSTGLVTVTGPGAVWRVQAPLGCGTCLDVGQQGTGTLRILNAGQVFTNGLDVGALGNGMVTISGRGSLLQIAPGGLFDIVEFGTGGVTVTDGGVLDARGTVTGHTTLNGGTVDPHFLPGAPA